MSLQNFSLPYSATGYFGTNASPSSQFFYNDANSNAAKIFSGVYGVRSDERHKQFQAVSASASPLSVPSVSSAVPVPGVDGNAFRQPTQYTRVTSGTDSRNGKTSVHAVVDYDDDFNDAQYSHENNDYNDIQNSIKQYPLPTVTPIQGPIFLKNGSVPVVPLYSYPKVNNGSFIQIPVSRLTTVISCDSF